MKRLFGRNRAPQVVTKEVTDPPTEGEVTEGDENKEKAYLYVPMGITSFSQLDDYAKAREQMEHYQESVWTLQDLISNIMWDSTVKDKTAALSALMDEFTQRVKENPDARKEVAEQPIQDSTPEQVTDRVKELLGDVEQVATLSLVDQVKEKRRLRQEFRALGAEIPPEIQGVDSTFALWKEADGSYRFAAVYSNNYEDRDKETICEVAHKSFTELANAGEVPMPELWHWHIPGTKWGSADHLLYEGGFAIAFGTIDPGHEKEAELLSGLGEIGVSHGMPRSTLVYDATNPGEIIFYTSREISTLPLEKAANLFTGFDIFSPSEEGDMQLTDEKKSFLKGLGYNDEQLTQIEGAITSKKEAATVAGIKSKEGEGEQQSDPQAQETVATEPVAAGGETDAPSGASTKEVVEAVAAVVKPLADLVKGLQTEVDGLKAQLVERDAQKAKQVLDETPVLSMKDLLNQAVFSHPLAQVKSTDPLASDGPVQNKEGASDQFAVTGIPVIDDAIRRSYQ